MSPKRPNRSKRALLATTLRRTGVMSALLRMPAWRGTVVLTYHRIGEGSSSDLYRGVFSATAERLDADLRFLTRWFDVIDPETFPGRGRGRRVLITFDDGYRDFYEHAHPALRAHGVHAALFVCSGFVDGTASAWWDEIAWMLRNTDRAELPAGPWSEQPLAVGDPEAMEASIETAVRAYWQLRPSETEPFLDSLAAATAAGRRPPADGQGDWISWEMVRELRQSGHLIGAHTVTHPILARLEAADQQREIADSAARIREQLGAPVDWLAFPVGVPGTHNASTVAAAERAGIALSFTNTAGWLGEGRQTSHELPRVPAETLRSADILSATLALPQVFLR